MEAFARSSFNRVARPFQAEAVSYLINGSKDSDGTALVVIRPPGDGKSLSYIMAGCFFNGITLVIQPTLALVADQSSKLAGFSTNSGLSQLVVFELNKCSTKNKMENLASKLRELKHSPKLPRIFLVASPDTLSDKEKPWLDLLLELAPHNIIRLIVADELHLVRDQGVAFRDAFENTGRRVISRIRKESPTTPVVAFTATATLEDIACVEQLYHFKTSAILWATPKEMEKRKVKIRLTCRQLWSSVAVDAAVPIMKSGEK